MLTHIPIALAGHDEFLDSIGLWFGKGMRTIKSFITGVTGSTFASPMVAPVPVGIHPNTASTPVFWASFAPKSVFCVAIFVAANKKTPFRIVIEEQVNRCMLGVVGCFKNSNAVCKNSERREFWWCLFLYLLSLPSVWCSRFFLEISEDCRWQQNSWGISVGNTHC